MLDTPMKRRELDGKAYSATYEKKGIRWQGILCCKKISIEIDKACSESKDPDKHKGDQ
jgi:hypothetical protein